MVCHVRQQQQLKLIAEIRHSVSRLLTHIEPADIDVNAPVILAVCEAAIYIPQKAMKFYVFTPDGRWQLYNKQEFADHMWRDFDRIFDHEALREQIELHNSIEGPKGRNRTDKTPADFEAAAWVKVRMYLERFNQRHQINHIVDMSLPDNSPGHIKLLPDDRVEVVWSHRPFEETGWREDIVNDYKEHWLETGCSFDEWIEWVVASRFAGDRKRAYLWMHCVSDWGKGLLMDLAGKDTDGRGLGLVVPIKVEEAERAFSGQPVGKDPAEFRRAWILFIDEFKNVKSEIKELQNSMRISPKNQLEVTVQLYAKVFASAEEVRSLASDATGIEDQFANRFSYLSGPRPLDARAMFDDVKNVTYKQSIKGYLAERLNKLVEKYRQADENAADDYLRAFHSKYGIAREFETMSGSLEGIAADFASWIANKYIEAQEAKRKEKPFLSKQHELVEKCLVKEGDDYLLKPLVKLSNEFIHETFDRAEIGTMGPKAGQLAKMVVCDYKQRWFGKNQNRKQVRCGVLKVTDEEKAAMQAADADLEAKEAFDAIQRDNVRKAVTAHNAKQYETVSNGY